MVLLWWKFPLFLVLAALPWWPIYNTFEQDNNHDDPHADLVMSKKALSLFQVIKYTRKNTGVYICPKKYSFVTTPFFYTYDDVSVPLSLSFSFIICFPQLLHRFFFFKYIALTLELMCMCMRFFLLLINK